VQPTSFDKPNEKLLLILLHFLLVKLEPMFAASVVTCWPYYETKEKNEFKRVVSIQMGKLIGSVLSTGDFRSSLLSVAKGSAMWVLLKKLSDAALEKTLRTVVMTYQTLPGSTLTVKASGALFESLSSTKAEDLVAAVQREYDEVQQVGNATMSRRSQHAQYAAELDERLTAANKTIQTAKTSMQRISHGEDVYYLSEGARIERTELILRINEIRAVIRQLSRSDVFADCDKVIQMYCPRPRATDHDSLAPNESGKATALFEDLKPLACDQLGPSAVFLERYNSTATRKQARLAAQQARRLRRAERASARDSDDDDDEDSEEEESEEEEESVGSGGDVGTLEDLASRAEQLVHTIAQLKPSTEQLIARVQSSLEFL
jgi:hypothetical protein